MLEQGKLQSLVSTKGKNTKRLGRGMGSGTGKTSGRGHKGAGARSGSVAMEGFEGGQTALYRKLPHRGFNSLTKGGVFTFTTDLVASLITSHDFHGDVVTKNDLVELGVCKLRDLKKQLKLIAGVKKLPLNVKIEADKASESTKKYLLVVATDTSVADVPSGEENAAPKKRSRKNAKAVEDNTEDSK